MTQIDRDKLTPGEREYHDAVVEAAEEAIADGNKRSRCQAPRNSRHNGMRKQAGAATVLVMLVLGCVVKSVYEYYYGPILPGASNGQAVQAEQKR